LRRADRRAARRLAKETGAQFACLYLEIDDATAKKRIAERAAAGDDPSDALWHVYAGQKRRFQRPSEVPADRLIALEAGAATHSQAKSARAAIHAISPLTFRA
jgi:predicted kinase